MTEREKCRGCSSLWARFPPKQDLDTSQCADWRRTSKWWEVWGEVCTATGQAKGCCAHDRERKVQRMVAFMSKIPGKKGLGSSRCADIQRTRGWWEVWEEGRCTALFVGSKLFSVSPHGIFTLLPCPLNPKSVKSGSVKPRVNCTTIRISDCKPYVGCYL